MRCFIALDVPKENLLSVQLPEAKLSRVKDFHITLRFLGEVADVELWVEKLKSLQGAFTATTTKIGVFPSEKKPRVIWLGVEPAAQFRRLVEAVGGKDFVPHITLARVKAVEDKEKFQKQLQQLKVEPFSFSVETVKLRKSTLTAQGPVYETLAEQKL